MSLEGAQVFWRGRRYRWLVGECGFNKTVVRSFEVVKMNPASQDSGCDARHADRVVPHCAFALPVAM
jgi:hypothetical protein